MPSGHRGKRAFPYGSESLCPHPSVIGGTRMSLRAEVAVVGGSVAGGRALGRWAAGRAGGLREAGEPICCQRLLRVAGAW